MKRNIILLCKPCFFFRRQLARERQQKLLAEFASKQKIFMEKTLKKDLGMPRLNLRKYSLFQGNVCAVVMQLELRKDF